MTVSSTTIKTAPFTGDGATVTFAFTWKVWAESEIKVILRLVSDGSETTLTLTTDYSVTLSADLPSAGSITTVATYSNLYEIVIKANFPQTQEVDYGEGDTFPAASHEEALDRGVRLSQQLDEQVGRSLLLPESTSFEDLVMPEPDADKVLGWNATATALENKTSSSDGAVTTHTADKQAHHSAAGAVTIAGGVLTITDNYDWVKVAGAGAADDDLDSIAGLTIGDVIELTPSSDSVTITVKHSASIRLAGGLDFIMNNQYDCIVLRCIAAGLVFREISRMNGGA